MHRLCTERLKHHWHVDRSGPVIAALHHKFRIPVLLFGCPSGWHDVFISSAHHVEQWKREGDLLYIKGDLLGDLLEGRRVEFLGGKKFEGGVHIYIHAHGWT